MKTLILTALITLTLIVCSACSSKTLEASRTFTGLYNQFILELLDYNKKTLSDSAYANDSEFKSSVQAFINRLETEYSPKVIDSLAKKSLSETILAVEQKKQVFNSPMITHFSTHTQYAIGASQIDSKYTEEVKKFLNDPRNKKIFAKERKLAEKGKGTVSITPTAS